MSESTPQETGRQEGPAAPKYFVVVEGVEHPWANDTIAFEDIIRLGGWSAAEGVIEIDEENRERTLQPGASVALKSGHGFSKKVRWRRG
jgi:hypothetical protein